MAKVRRGHPEGPSDAGNTLWAGPRYGGFLLRRQGCLGSCVRPWEYNFGHFPEKARRWIASTTELRQRFVDSGENRTCFLRLTSELRPMVLENLFLLVYLLAMASKNPSNRTFAQPTGQG